MAFKRYAFACGVLLYMASIIGLHLIGRFPRPGLYDLSRLAGGSVATIKGRVIDSPVIRWGQTRFVLTGKAQPMGGFQGKMCVTLAFPDETLAPGDELVLRGWLSTPRPSGPRRLFDERGYWAGRQVYSLLKVWSPDGLQVKRRSTAWNLRRLAWKFRRRYQDFWQQALPEKEAALLLGTTIGARGVLPADVKDACIRAGVYHIVVVSGQNMSLIVALGVSLLLLFQVPRRHAFWLCLLPILFYAAAVGEDPPVLRAAAMALVGLLVSALGRDIPRYYPLFLAAAWILAFEPEALLGASFQLSFGATLSILMLFPLDRQTRSPRWKRSIKEAALIGLAVHIGIWPLLVYYFHRLSFGGFLANWTVFPLSGVLMVLGLTIGTWGVVAPATVPDFALRIVFTAVRMTLALIRGMASWRYVVLSLPAPSLWSIGLYYGFLFGILFLIRRRTLYANHRPRLQRR
jgi:competence protein ComEC